MNYREQEMRMHNQQTKPLKGVLLGFLGAIWAVTVSLAGAAESPDLAAESARASGFSHWVLCHDGEQKQVALYCNGVKLAETVQHQRGEFRIIDIVW